MSAWPHSLEFLTQCFPTLKQFNFVAQGGQKAVYSSLHPTAGLVALKILPPNSQPERFQRELIAIQAIDADQVPVVFESGSLPAPYEGHFWMTEQWIPGITLRVRLQLGVLSESLVLLIATSILEVLVKAEHHRIVHRDIKPENIIISPDETKCWLIDFGIARHLDKTSLTGLTMPCTIGYAPLEQLEVLKHQIDIRSDLFSLGVTLFECVEGINPFIDGAVDSPEVFQRISNNQLPCISKSIGGSDEFGKLIQSMTKTKRTHRIRTAEDAMQWITEINMAVASK